MSGLSAHIRGKHPEAYGGSVAASIPKGFNVGKPGKKRYKRQSRELIVAVDTPAKRRSYARKKSSPQIGVNFCYCCGAPQAPIGLIVGFVNK